MNIYSKNHPDKGNNYSNCHNGESKQFSVAGAEWARKRVMENVGTEEASPTMCCDCKDLGFYSK